jgi:hypothetical protein
LEQKVKICGNENIVKNVLKKASKVELIKEAALPQKRDKALNMIVQEIDNTLKLQL